MPAAPRVDPASSLDLVAAPRLDGGVSQFVEGGELVVRVVRAERLYQAAGSPPCDPYVVLMCERQTLRTRAMLKTANPAWNEEVRALRGFRADS